MPTEPSSQLLSKWLKRPEKITGPKREIKPLDPSWLRTGFEGTVDTILGALGVGPDTTANRFGSVLSASMPMVGAKRIKGPGRYPEFDLVNSPPEVFPVQNRLAMGMIPENAMVDEAGRMIGTRPPANPAYEAHVASSRNKYPILKRTGPTDDLAERMMRK